MHHKLAIHMENALSVTTHNFAYMDCIQQIDTTLLSQHK